jgi:hypothetical protein
MKRMQSIVPAVLVLVLTLGVIPVFGDVLEDPTVEELLEGANFVIVPRVNFKGSFWILDQETDKIIGHAPWDAVNRRWNLFTLNNEYYGFIQATIGSLNPRHFTQYLWYDKDNRYKGVFIANLGGRPVTPDLPFGELGGDLARYDYGNIPMTLPQFRLEVDPLKLFPDGVDVGPIDSPSGR